MNGGPRTALTRTLIASAALGVLDEEGVDSLTLREVARRLEVKASSLYNHVRSKSEILDLVTELIVSKVDLSLLEGPDWRAGLRHFATTYRDAFLAHPNAAAVIARRAVETPTALRYYARSVALLTEAGWPPATALEIVLAVDYIVMGSIIVPFSTGFVRPPASYGADHAPLAAAISAVDPATVDDTAFRATLEAYLTGLGDPLAG
ncbi:TetR/AcrR family transcriptional regulator [Nocardiopsis lucentensis]|uniref:TetR/AcrR family transcriptional regulator n=1 Tax=Nocardiopsis lucentensis TaxID=53441 RepID=UPI0003497F24|nr:TetR/AcrR family transcriptional regulator C-terminal domain-containing protein [Nocardiopsis lucentensis]